MKYYYLLNRITAMVVAGGTGQTGTTDPKEILGGVSNLLDVFIYGVQIVGVFVVLKGILDLSTAWPAQDIAGMKMGGMILVSGALMFASRWILMLMGMSL